MQCKTYSLIAEIAPALWDGLFATDNPFVQHAYLLALEESGCVAAETGWQPLHIVLYNGGRAIAAMPSYIKSHSYGEFVFDWGWAEAYTRHGMHYYPKLVSAIPFSPVAGPRIGVAQDIRPVDAYAEIIEAARQLVLAHDFSSWHLLFPDLPAQRLLADVVRGTSILNRKAVQFCWVNRGFGMFGEFLDTLRSSRRKNIKRERRKVAEQGVSLQRKCGQEISDEDWRAFYRCYMETYRKRSGHDGYLNQGFFALLRQNMADNLMLVVATRDGEAIAASLFLYDSQTLYGRYWGALQDVSCLHFEACFYQGIEFCIEHKLTRFDPGTQGEHKLIRGFEPYMSASCHWIRDQGFRAAIEEFLVAEKQSTEAYRQQAVKALPFKQP